MKAASPREAREVAATGRRVDTYPVKQRLLRNLPPTRITAPRFERWLLDRTRIRKGEWPRKRRCGIDGLDVHRIESGRCELSGLTARPDVPKTTRCAGTDGSGESAWHADIDAGTSTRIDAGATLLARAFGIGLLNGSNARRTTGDRNSTGLLLLRLRALTRIRDQVTTRGRLSLIERDLDLTARNKAIAYKGQYELLVDKDMSALDRYWGDYYLQHNPGLRNGLPELKIFKSANVPGATTQLIRCFGDRDLVFFQERVTGLMPYDLCFFDLYRMEEGKIVEHWDAFQESHGPNPAGRTIFDGPVDIERPEQTEATRAVVTGLVSRVFVMDQMDALDRYVAPDLIQNTPGLHDGIAGLNRRFLEAQWFTGTINYIALRRVIAEGEFAVTCSQAEVAGVPYGLYDLWRVADGKVVEHWSLSQEAKQSAFHDNPMI